MGSLERLTYLSTAPEHTRRLGEAIGAAARPGDVLLLDGPFGAGKTVMVQGLAAGLGIREDVTSPSFVLVHEHHGRLTLFHVDLYRLEGVLDAETIEELEEYVGGGGVCAIEWPGSLPPDLRANATELRFATIDDGTRSIELRTPSAVLADAARSAGMRDDR